MSRSEHERLQGAAPDLTPWTIIALGSDMVPLRECMDGKLFDMSIGTFAVWLLIFSKLSEDDTRAFLAGDMTFYGATQRVVASDARDPSSYQERQLRHYKALVNDSQNGLAKKTSASINASRCCEKSRSGWPRWRGRHAFTRRWWRP